MILVVFAMLGAALASFWINLRTDLNTACLNDNKQLQTHSALMQSMKELAFQIGHQVYADNRVASLLYGTNRPIREKYLAMNQLNIYRASLPYIESIYVYNGASRTFAVSSMHSGNMDISYEAMVNADPLVNEIISQAEIQDLLTPFPHMIEYPESYKKDTYCYTYVVSELYGHENIRQAVFVNFSTRWLQQILKEQPDSRSETMMVDDKGDVLFSTIPDHIQLNIGDSDLFSCIQELRQQPDSVVRNLEAGKYLLTVQPSPEKGWTFVRITPYSVMREASLPSLKMMLLFDLILLVLYVVVSLAASRRLYSPIERMGRQLDNVQDEKQALEINNRQKRFMRKLLLDSSVSDQHEQLVCEVSEADEAFCNGDTYNVLLHIDRYNRFCNTYSLQERAARMERLIEIGKEVLNRHFLIRTLELGEGSNIVFVMMSTDSELLDRNAWLSLIQQIREHSLEELSIKFSCAISAPGSHIGELSALYHQAYNALRYRIFSNGGATIFSEDIQQYEHHNYAYPEDVEERMIMYIMNGESEEACCSVREILNGMGELPFLSMQLGLSRLSSALLSAMKKTEGSNFSFPTDLSDTLIAAAFLEEIDSFETTVHYYENVIIQMCSCLQEKRDTRYLELVDNINELINCHYSDPDCSLAYIARQINLSDSYITRLYRSRMLKSIPDHITEVRMEAARKLLRDRQDLSITEISKQVGFSSISYFSKTFRRKHGMTPNEYRNSNDHDQGA